MLESTFSMHNYVHTYGVCDYVASVKHTEVITCSEELQLNAGIMGTHSSSALLNAVFFMNGKVLHLPLPLVQMRLASLLFTRKMAQQITQAVTKMLLQR